MCEGGREKEKKLQFIRKKKNFANIWGTFKIKIKAVKRKWNKKKQNENEIRNYLVLFIVYVN